MVYYVVYKSKTCVRATKKKIIVYHGNYLRRNKVLVTETDRACWGKVETALNGHKSERSRWPGIQI